MWRTRPSWMLGTPLARLYDERGRLRSDDGSSVVDCIHRLLDDEDDVSPLDRLLDEDDASSPLLDESDDPSPRYSEAQQETAGLLLSLDRLRQLGVHFGRDFSMSEYVLFLRAELLAAEQGRDDSLADEARVGNRARVEAMVAEGHPLTAEVATNAARSGHLDLLKWLRSRGCPWDERTCAGAAMMGHMQMLQWAHFRGCPWDVWTTHWAKMRGDLEMHGWARSQGCPVEDLPPECETLARLAVGLPSARSPSSMAPQGQAGWIARIARRIS